MKQFLFVVLAICGFSVVLAQSKKSSTKELINKAGDHVMIQFATDFWSGTPDSLKSRMKKLGRGINVAVMLNRPFKSNPMYSVAFGVGVSTSNVYFNRNTVDIKSTATKLPFSNFDRDSLNYFKKYKLSTAYLEIPLEFRYTADPINDKKSIKAAIGIKIGTLLSVHTKGKTLINKNGGTVSSYTEKETSKKFFNSTRIAATARVGYGIFSLFGSYQFTNIFKDGVAPEIKPYQIGLTISGL